MGASGVIKSFLVSLGFDIDQSSYSKFASGVRAATKQAALLGASVTAAAGAVFKGVLSTADGLDQLSDVSARVNVPVDKIEELGYIASQTDSSMGAVQGSLERLSRSAGEAALGVGRGAMTFKKLGIEAKDANGNVKGTADLLAEIGGKIKGMGSSERMAFLERVGIDRTMVGMLTNDVSALSAEYHAMYKTAGVDANEAASAASDFMDEWGKLKTVSSMLYRAINVGFMMKFKGDITRLRKTIIENADSIKKIVTAIISLVTKAAGAIGAAVMRVIGWIVKLGDWFASLDAGTKSLILTVGALLAAWKLLNLGFLASPLGALAAGLTALFVVVDDLLTYMEGGESYLDWGGWMPQIEKIVSGFKVLRENVSSFVSGFIEGFSSAWDKFDSMFLKPLISGFKSAGSWIANAMGKSESNGEMFESLGKGIGKLIGVILSLSAAGHVLVSPLKAVGSAAGLFIGGFRGIIKITQALFAPFGLLVRGLGRLFPVVSKIGLVFFKLSGVIFRTVIPAVLKFSAALLTNPITWIVAGILLLVAGLYLLYKNWDKAKAKFQEWYDLAVQKIGELIAWFGNLRDRIGERLSEIKERIVNAFLAAWENVKAKGLELVGWFKGIPQKIGGALLGLAEIILDPFKKAIDKVRKLWDGFMGFFRKDKDEIEGAQSPGGSADRFGHGRQGNAISATPVNAGASTGTPAGATNNAGRGQNYILERIAPVYENTRQMQQTQLTPPPSAHNTYSQETSNTQTNNIKNDTTVNIYESKDAKATGEAVGSEIDRISRNSGNAIRPMAPDARPGRGQGNG